MFNGRNHDIPFMLINQHQGCQKIDIQMLIHIKNDYWVRDSSSNTQTGAQPFLLFTDEHVNNADATSVVSKNAIACKVFSWV